MTQRFGKIGVFVFGLSLLSPAAQADVLSPYQAVYELNRGSVMLGDTTFTMSKKDNDCYHLKGVAEPKGLAALFAGRMTEESHFCVENGQIRSQDYSVNREGGDEDDSYTLRFDWGNQLVTTNSDAPRELPTEGVDRTVMELALRQQLAKHLNTSGDELPSTPLIFLMVEDDEIKPYRFQVTGKEILTTPIGKFEAIKVERMNSERRQFRLWMAPALDYLPIRLERQKKDKPAISMQLRALPLSPAAD